MKTTDGGANWAVLPTGVSTPLTAVFFYDLSTGWAVGAGGKILCTTNGGSSWTLQPAPTTQNLWSVCFVSPYDGWAVGSNGVILRTTTGGIVPAFTARYRR